MFHFFRRHQTWGLIVIALVIVSFVIFFSPYSKMQGRSGGGSGDLGSIGGRPVEPDEYYHAVKEARLEYLLRYRTWPEDNPSSRQMGYDPQRQAMNRLLLLKQLKELKIEASDQAVANQIAEYFRDAEKGAFDLQNYEAFLQHTLAQAGISRREFEDFVRHEVGIAQLVAVAGLHGQLVTPREAEASYRLENEQLSTEVVVFPSSNYLASVTVDPAALAQFYTNRQSVYRIPERVQVSYVKFDVTNYLAEADQTMAQNTNINRAIEMMYRQRGTNYYADAAGQPLSEAAAKEKIKEEIRRGEFALPIARKKASAFANELYNQPVQPDILEKFAAAQGYQTAVSEPFSEAQGPSDLPALKNFGEKAFKLTPEAPFSAPIPTEEGVYIVALKNRIPSSVPPLDSIRDILIADYRNTQARDLARQAGFTFYNTLTNGLAQGKSFDTVCQEANVTPIKVPPFSSKTSTLPQFESTVSLQELKNVAFNLVPGKPSTFVPSRQGGFVLYVVERLPVSADQLKTELASHMAEMRQERLYMAFNEWFNKETEKAKVRMPKTSKEAN